MGWEWLRTGGSTLKVTGMLICLDVDDVIAGLRLFVINIIRFNCFN
ncbi:hypothetical protein [Candidatus Hodgkinia cicadicola]